VILKSLAAGAAGIETPVNAVPTASLGFLTVGATQPAAFSNRTIEPEGIVPKYQRSIGAKEPSRDFGDVVERSVYERFFGSS
jgi:hypothetical protein